MNYDNQIYQTLVEADGRELSVHKIALHVCNASNTLFESIDFDDVRNYVQRFLLRNVKNADSAIKRGQKRGTYCLNLKSRQGKLLFQRYSDHEDSSSQIPQTPDDKQLSLPLF